MASNKVTMSHNHGYTLTVEAIQNSQNITANTSNVTISLKLTSTNKSFAQYSYSAYLYLDGTAKASHDDTTTSLSIGLNTTVTLLTWTGNVSHGNDGKKTITVRGTSVIPRSGNTTSYSPGSGDVSVTLKLSDIARASSASVSSSSVTLGNSISLTITPKAAYSHYITLTLGGTTVYSSTQSVISSAATYSISTSTSWGQYISTAMSSTAVLSIQTKNGNTNIGNPVTLNITLNVPSYSLSSYLSRTVNSLKNTYGYYTELSSIGWKITGSPPYGATIISAVTKLNGKNVSGTNVNPILLTSTGSNLTLTSTVTDSRGKTAVISNFTYSVERYTPLKINSVTTSRSTTTDTTVTVTVSGSFTSYGLNSSGKPNNTLSSTSCTLGTVTQSANTVTYSNYGFTLRFTFTGISTNEAVDGNVSVQESIYPQSSPATYNFTLPTAIVPLDFHHSGQGVAIGKVAEEPDILEVGYDSLFYGDVETEGNLDIGGNLRIGGNRVYDYVTAYGTSGIWTYRKWFSGIAECWGRKAVNTIVATAWGNVYASGALEALNIAYPFTFKELPTLTTNLTCNGYGAILMVPGATPHASTTSTGVFEICRGSPAANNVTYIVNYHAIGKWK